jgi:hypothetical protein
LAQLSPSLFSFFIESFPKDEQKPSGKYRIPQWVSK